MPLNELINTYLDKQCVNNTIEDINIKKDIISHPKKHISQHELMNAIHQEFQKSFIRKLYPNPSWINRIFWNVVGTLQQKYYDELSLDQITTAIKQYLKEHKMIIPNELSQRDVVKFIRDTINELQTDGITKTIDVSKHVIENGTTPERFEQAIKKMKTEGSIFEPKEGYYKCV